MRIVWDEPKRRANLEKHGFDFADVIYFDWSTAVVEATYGNRMKAVGHFHDGTAVVIFAALGAQAISIVSFRPARKSERKVLR